MASQDSRTVLFSVPAEPSSGPAFGQSDQCSVTGQQVQEGSGVVPPFLRPISRLQLHPLLAGAWCEEGASSRDFLHQPAFSWDAAQRNPGPQRLQATREPAVASDLSQCQRLSQAWIRWGLKLAE